MNYTAVRTSPADVDQTAIASIERDRRIQATKACHAAERDLERNTRKLAKDRAARTARDKCYQDLVDDLKHRKGEYENQRSQAKTQTIPVLKRKVK